MIRFEKVGRTALFALLLALPAPATADDELPYPVWWSPVLELDSIEGIAALLEHQGLKVHCHKDDLEWIRRGTGVSESDLVSHGSGDVVEVAFTLRDLEVPSIPVNFLIPIDGNPIQSDGSLTPERALRTLCLFRLANPSAEVRAAAPPRPLRPSRPARSPSPPGS